MTTNKLQNESEKDYGLFQTYRLMGFGRSITELADMHKVSRQHIYNLIKKFDWKARIAAHDKNILDQIREEHNKSFQADSLLRRENLVSAYSLLQNTFSKMLSYSDKYTSNTMEPEEFLNKTDKLFKIIQRYERISQSCEKYLAKFGIETEGQTSEIQSDLENVNNKLEDFNEENNELNDSENSFEDGNNEPDTPTQNNSLDLNSFAPQSNSDIDLTEEELQKIDYEVKNDFPSWGSEKDRKNYRQNLIIKKIKHKYKTKLSEKYSKEPMIV